VEEAWYIKLALLIIVEGGILTGNA